MSEPAPATNSELQQLRRLSRRRSARSEHGTYLADGPVLLAEALRARAPVQLVVAEAGALGLPAVHEAASAGIAVRHAPDGSLAKVLDLRSPQGVVAVVRSASVGLDHLVARCVELRRPVLVVVGLQDPGNLGTLVRVAEAAGCAGVVTTPGSVDLHNPKTVRSTAGAVFRVPVAEGVELADAADRCRAAGVPVVATVGEGGLPPEQVRLDGPAAVLIGPEAHGLPTGVVGSADIVLSVPMEGAVESLNAAVAGSLVVFEAARQRRAAGVAAADRPATQEGTGWRGAGPDATQ